MTYELLLKAEANNDIVQAYRWYESQQESLGESFLQEVEYYLERIVKHPLQFPRRHKKKRAAALKRFPYLIVFELMDEQVIVFAMFNTHQNPKKLYKRK